MIANKTAQALAEVWHGRFEPDERLIRLEERLQEYYLATPSSMDNREALNHYKAFKDWCRDNGYTSEEINRAKRARKYICP